MAQNTSREEKDALIARDEADLVRDLANAGITVKSVWDLVNSDNYYLAGVPVLIAHLKKNHHPKVLAGIARSLAIPSLRGDEEAWEVVKRLYLSTPANSEIDEPFCRGAKQALGIALSVLIDRSRVAEARDILVMQPNTDGSAFIQQRLDRFKNV